MNTRTVKPVDNVSGVRIDWNELCRDPMAYEALVNLLLQRLYPGGQVVDGAGGDEGREFEVRTSTRLDLFEAKSFTGRIGAAQGRRAQVERSLNSAARHQPDAWHLVAPIDPSPPELRWMQRLRGLYPFELIWCGKTWLDERLAAHEDLIRSTQTVRDEVLNLAGKHHLENSVAARGIPDLIERQAHLDALGDSLSRDWRPVFFPLNGGGTGVTLEAKNPDAAVNSPIRFEIGIKVPAGEATEVLRTQLRSAIEVGSGVEVPGEFVSSFAIDGPAGLGLPGADSHMDHLVISPILETVDLPQFSLAVRSPGALLPIAALPFRSAHRTRGVRGAVIVAVDEFRTVEMQLDVRAVQAASGWDTRFRLRVRSRGDGPALPAALVGGIRLMRAMRSPNEIVLTTRVQGKSATQVFDSAAAAASDVEPDQRIADYIEDLAVIQDKLRQPFPLPELVTPEEARVAGRMRALLEAGAGVGVSWPVASFNATVNADGISEFKAQFANGGGTLRMSTNDWEFTFGTEVVHTGPMYFEGPVEIDVNSVPDEAPAGENVQVTFRSIGDGFTAYLGDPPGEPPVEPGADGHRRGRVSYGNDPDAHPGPGLGAGDHT